MLHSETVSDSFWLACFVIPELRCLSSTVDLFFVNGQELENVGIRLNRKPPDVTVRQTKGGGAEDTLKPLSRTNSVVEPELAGEVNAGKSHQLAFRWWKTYRKNLVTCNHYLFSLNCMVFTSQIWRCTVL